MCAHTEKTTLLCKDYYGSEGKGLVLWQSKHGAGHISLCSIFSKTLWIRQDRIKNLCKTLQIKTYIRLNKNFVLKHCKYKIYVGPEFTM